MVLICINMYIMAFSRSPFSLKSSTIHVWQGSKYASAQLLYSLDYLEIFVSYQENLISVFAPPRVFFWEIIEATIYCYI